MEYRYTVEVTEYGFDPANGEKFLDALMETHPETGPAVSQNTETGVLTAVLSFDAPSVTDVAEHAIDLFTDGAALTGLPPTTVLSVLIELVREEDESPTEEREQVFA
jgi:hypothetical protein